MRSPESTGGRAARADPTLGLPRILCLHGGGTNARIFRAQCRMIRLHLAGSFRLVFADASFPSQPGPDVTSVYGDWGPFRAWLPLPTMECVVDKIDESITSTMRADNQAGASGPWVGLLGFSQGARVAASLLMRQQRHNQNMSSSQGQNSCASEISSLGYRFAVLIAGSGPLIDMCVGCDNTRPKSDLLQLPTIHVHGLRDPGIEMHRDLLHCCLSSTVRLVEWDGDHRVPLTTTDVSKVVAEIYDVASES